MNDWNRVPMPLHDDPEPPPPKQERSVVGGKKSDTKTPKNP